MDNLKSAISGETAEFKDMYPKFIEQAKNENASDAVILSFDVATRWRRSMQVFTRMLLIILARTRKSSIMFARYAEIP